jgi:hypothetical protein
MAGTDLGTKSPGTSGYKPFSVNLADGGYYNVRPLYKGLLQITIG